MTDAMREPGPTPEPNAVAEPDVVAVGCGPFNLGLAALASTVDDLTVVVLEAEPELSWHPGLLFDDALLQVSFLADLVSLVDPTHPLSFLAYLRDRDRLYRFHVRERFHPTRVEYQDYLRWAAGRLPSVRFGHRVTELRWDGTDGRFAVRAERPDGTSTMLRAPNVVLGIGTVPAMPACLAALPAERVLHSSAYLRRRGDLDTHDAVTVVGSGQSGAEVMRDLLRRDTSTSISWLTRTGSFAPLDYTKLVLEMTTPAYVSHFHGLPERTRDALVAAQWRHYKGISAETVEELHDLLYRRELAGAAPTLMRVGTAVESATVGPGSTDGRVELTCRDADTGAVFTHRTGIVVAATGYRERPADFIADVAPLLQRDAAGRLVVKADHSVATDDTVTGRVFVANADLHSHGVAAPDLGIGAVRNATIINTITGRTAYPLPVDTAFTTFGPARR